MYSRYNTSLHRVPVRRGVRTNGTRYKRPNSIFGYVDSTDDMIQPNDTERSSSSISSKAHTTEYPNFEQISTKDSTKSAPIPVNHNDPAQKRPHTDKIRDTTGIAVAPDDNDIWKTRTLELQADMDNFRKRQIRRADEAITAERKRLLKAFLPAVDNLDRALTYQENDNNEALRQGVELTHRELLRMLEAEGVSALKTINQPFDPQWHEAVAVVPAEAESGTIIQEVAGGYTLDDKLLRPAEVVVAE